MNWQTWNTLHSTTIDPYEYNHPEGRQDFWDSLNDLTVYKLIKNYIEWKGVNQIELGRPRILFCLSKTSKRKGKIKS